MQQDPSSETGVEDPSQHGATGDEERPPEESAVAAEGEEQNAEGEGAVEEEPEEKVPPTLEEQLAEWKERAIRATADLENFRKRMAREKSESLRYANQALLEELLPVLDNFEMGLQAAAADSESMIFRGMEMVKKQLDDFLSGQGAEEIAAEGEQFDPNVHEAVSQEESAEAEEGAVLRVLRRGYRLRERLLRPANVVVAKAPEGEAEPAAEGGEQ